MSNMSYCRFQNTANDLADCFENLYSLDPNAEGMNDRAEREAREQIVILAARILEELGIEDPADDQAVLDAVADIAYVE